MNGFKLKDWAFLLVPIVTFVAGYSTLNYQVNAQAKEAEVMEKTVAGNMKDIVDLRIAVSDINGNIKTITVSQNNMLELLKEVRQAVKS